MKKSNGAHKFWFLILICLLIGNIWIMVKGEKGRIEAIREEVNKFEECSLNAITIGQVYEVNGKKYFLADFDKWDGGTRIDLLFRISE